MKGDYNKRIKDVLAAIDALTAGVAQFHEQQQLRVRDGGRRARLTAYRACQYCVSAKSALAAARATLFTDPTENYDGPDGEVNTEQNEELLCMRFHDSAGNLGLTAEQCADAVLICAAAHCVIADNAFVSARFRAGQSELDELLTAIFCD
ncbi:MAG: hypothetical protein K2W95_28700 [Candidatus Obscuribacterales bacterium]|nr:hypothetical protein [Candidatus Obscuribacterales bacterium]